MIRHRLGLGAVLATALLAGCAVAPGFRDTRVPISSTTRFDLARFAGDWQVTARMAEPADPNATLAEGFRIRPDGAVVHETGNCNASGCAFFTHDETLAVTGLGRYMLDGRAHWVLWVDADFRTAVIGTPSGAFGWIMENGDGATPPDRMQAAREILEWMGYDLSLLVEVRP